MKRRWKVLFGLIILLAGVLRLYQLGKTPISLEWDEVAIGYDAYCLLKTGRDQFGKFLPLTFRSLDDWKPPIYEYLTVPSIAIFGLNGFSARLPSAVFGVFTVVLTFWLVREIFSELPIKKTIVTSLSLVACLLLAISPWHLQFSRAAFEVNISVLITTASVLFFLKGLKNPRFFLLSALFFGINLFSYHSSRVVGPLLLLLLFLIFNKNLPTKRYLLSFLFIFLIFFIAILPILTSPDAQIRFRATNIFKPGARYLDEKDLEKIFLEARLMDKAAGFELAGKIFHNQRFIFLDWETLVKAFKNYLSNFSFEYLFIKGDAPLHHAPGFGLLYIYELPFLLIGLAYLVTKGLNRYTLIIPLWLLIAPLPNAVTREAPHAVRTELILPMYQLVAALGMVSAFEFIRKESKWVLNLFMVFVAFALLINLSFYLHQYYVHTNYELSDKWLYGRKEAAEFTEKVKDDYDKILVSMKVDMPHIFWLFYTKYPPEKYLAEGGTVSGGFADERNHFDKYEFRNFDYNNLPSYQKLLLVGIPKDFPSDAKVIKTIYYLDGAPAILIAEGRR